MALIYNVKPFLDLGICKEYFMARKTTENGFSIRRKKTETTVPPTGLQETGISPNSSNDTRSNETQGSRNGKPLNPVPINQHSMSQASSQQNSQNGPVRPELEEEIRHRAYELYLQRRADGREVGGDPHQDWLTAEREILSRRTSRERKSA
jgi:Protein of unknown function (DUF2934)